MKTLTATRNGIELNAAQKAAVKRAFYGDIQMLHADGKEMELEYFNSNNNGVKVVLSEILHGIKFERLSKFVGERGGLTGDY